MKSVNYIISLFFLTSVAHATSALEECAAKKLKDFRVKILVTIAEESRYLEKFRTDCAKTTMMTTQEKQEQARVAAEKAAKEKEIATKLASTAAPAVAPPAPVAAAAPPPPVTADGDQPKFVVGPCGTPEQCAAGTALTYNWTVPGQIAATTEMWMNGLDLAAGIGGTYEKPEDPCKDSNQGQLIALDLGTELVGVLV